MRNLVLEEALDQKVSFSNRHRDAAPNALCGLREQLEILEILKSNGLNFAQF